MEERNGLGRGLHRSGISIMASRVGDCVSNGAEIGRGRLFTSRTTRFTASRAPAGGRSNGASIGLFAVDKLVILECTSKGYSQNKSPERVQASIHSCSNKSKSLATENESLSFDRKTKEIKSNKDGKRDTDNLLACHGRLHGRLVMIHVAFSCGRRMSKGREKMRKSKHLADDAEKRRGSL